MSRHTRDVVSQDGARASSEKVSFPSQSDCLSHSYRHRDRELCHRYEINDDEKHIGKHLSVTGSIGLSLSLSTAFLPLLFFYIHTERYIISHSLPIYSFIYLSVTLSLSILICFCFFLSHSLVRSSLCSTTKWSTVKQTPRKRLLSILPANEIRLISDVVSEETFSPVE